ncbi:MAG: ligB [Gemmatimonadetes bacterium]|nr:ligB [Gemmatimonadota bacterium]
MTDRAKFADVVATSAEVAATSGRLAKVALLADLLQRVPHDELRTVIGFLIGWPRQNKLGVGWAAVSKARDQQPAPDATLTVHDADVAFDALLATTGKSSSARRAQILTALFGRATEAEQRFLGALIVGEVRQGALEGVLVEAIAKAAVLPPERVRRAAMLAGDLATVGEAVLSRGAEALHAYGLELFRPVSPMLADSAESVADALTGDAEQLVEWKLDGARIQVHVSGDRVAVYTRNQNDVTGSAPEVVDVVRTMQLRDAILDGEVIALAPDGRPRSFQTTMRRFGRRRDTEAMRAEIPLTAFFFDVLLLNGETLIDLSLAERRGALDAVLPDALRVPSIITADPVGGARFQEEAIARGHEGIMIKNLAAPYAAGRRGSAWMKVKTARTLDLVVLAAEWGSGRRTGWLSNIHLGARDPDTGGFVMLGKTFKGMTDEMLAWQTSEFLAREERRDGHIIYLRPELVVEVAFNEVQESSQYPGGATLRFARVKGYRPDKRVEEADTIGAVRALM